MTEAPPSRPCVALVPWGDVWDDYLDSIGVSLETFCRGGASGWLLGYVQALAVAGIRSVVILVSARVTKPVRFRNDASGVDITVLPAPASYLWIRRRMANPNPYLAKTIDDIVGHSARNRRLLTLLNFVGAYLATPLGLLAAELRRERCAAILCQDYESPRFDACTLLGKLVGARVYACFQSGNFDPNPIGRRIRPLTMKACDGLIVGPDQEIQRVQDRYGVDPQKIAQVFNPVDVTFWRATDRGEARALLGVSPDAKVVMWHGRIDMNAKRLDVLLDAWQAISTSPGSGELQLLLLGAGEDSALLRERIAALPVQNVRWISRFTADREEIRRFLSAGDVYAFPSVFEGFPVAPIEAMACGLPLVGAMASGVAEILKNGEASGGLLVPCGDVPAFTSALRRMLEDHAWRRRLGALARARVEDALSLQAVGRQFSAFLLPGGSVRTGHVGGHPV